MKATKSKQVKSTQSQSEKIGIRIRSIELSMQCTRPENGVDAIISGADKIEKYIHTGYAGKKIE